MQFLLDTVLEYPIWSAVLGILMLIALVFSKNNFLKFILILATPTTPIDKLKKGKSEIKGKVKAIETIKETGYKAVYHKHVEEAISDGEDESWEVIDEGEDSVPFYVVDTTGKVLIKPEDATIDLAKKSQRLIKHSSTSRTKHSYLLDGDNIYILGNFNEDKDENFIAKKDDDQFIISNIKEGKLLLKYGFKGMILFLVTLFVIGFALSKAKVGWLKTWEGEVVSKWVDDYEDSEGEDVYVYMIELDTGETIDIGRSRYSEVKVKDYLAKFRGKYKFEIMKGNTKKVIEVKKEDTTKSDTTKVIEENKVEIKKNTEIKKDTEVKKSE